jgi:phosphate/sulfate permease
MAAAGVVTFIASFFLLLPWIKNNLPSVNHSLLGDHTSSSGEDSSESNNGIKMTAPTDIATSTAASTAASTADQRKSNRGDSKSSNADNKCDPNIIINDNKPPPTETDDVLFCFRILLVFNAALKSFAHGANVTASAVGPFSAVLEIYNYGLDICWDHNRTSPVWILILAGGFLALGIVTLGHRVIETIGKKLTVINYHSGFCIEFGSCVTVVLATELGIPVSTTHCQIGAVVGTGLLISEKDSVAWDLIGKIVLTWVLTLPFSCLLSYAILEMLRSAFK